MLLMQTVRKDFLAYKKTLLWIPFYILIFPLLYATFTDKTSIFVMLLGICTYMWIGSVLAYDEKYKADAITGILPVKRSTILLGKIVMTDLVILGVTMVHIALCIINLNFPVKAFVFPTFSHFAAGVLLSSLMILILLPSCYKWGYQRSRVVMIIIMVMIIMVPSMLLAYFDAVHDELAGGIGKGNMTELVFSAYTSISMLVLAAICQATAYLLSYRLIKRKDIV